MCRRSVDCQRGYGPMRIEMSCCMSPCGFGICVAKQKSNAYVIGQWINCLQIKHFQANNYVFLQAVDSQIVSCLNKTNKTGFQLNKIVYNDETQKKCTK